MKSDQRRLRFVDEYLKDGNAMQAAIRAGYSPNGAGAQGHRLLQNAKIKAQIRKSQMARSARTGVHQDKVIKELARIAFSDPRQVATWGPDGVSLKDAGQLSDDDAAIIESLSYSESSGKTESKSVRFKLHNKLNALELLGKHLNIFKEPMPLDQLLAALPESVRPIIEQSLLAEIQRRTNPSGNTGPTAQPSGDVQPASA